MRLFHTRSALRDGREQANSERRDEVAELCREHRDELAAERQRADAAMEVLRTEHRREVDVPQTALEALRLASDETVTS